MHQQQLVWVTSELPVLRTISSCKCLWTGLWSSKRDAM